MSTDPHAVRSIHMPEIGSVIERDAGLIIQRWAAQAKSEQPTASRVHHEALLDSLPGLLEDIGRRLAKPYEGASHIHTAVTHGEQRWEIGWSLTDVIRDYQMLRLIVKEYLEEVIDRPVGCRESMAIDLALDEAITASVAQYVRSRDEFQEQVEESRREEDAKVQESLRQQSEALRDADRRKNEFFATLSHELRNPLAPLRNAVAVLRLHTTTDPLVRQVRDIIERQVIQLARLVDDLLDVSRISQGKIELRRERLSLESAINQAVQMSEPLFRTRRHHFELTVVDSPLWIDGDEARLAQIFVNLLNNAAKYTRPGGRITLEARTNGNQAIVRVRDNGIGISREMLAHVFELFTQAELSPDGSQGGMGIGLSLVRKLVELHGGTISVHSDGPGSGSEFTVILPLAQQDGQVASRFANSPPLSAQRRHILIVEDNIDGRESLQVLLTLLGHRVDVAEDGLKGVELALETRPEVVLIDIGLPGLNGYQVAEKLRAAFGDGTLLVALTGSGQPEDRRRAREVGFDAHLIKPVELDELQKLLVRSTRASQAS